MAVEHDLLTKRRESERDHWISRLIRLGITPANAALIVGGSADLHQVEEALQHGCPPETAVQIFA